MTLDERLRDDLRRVTTPLVDEDDALHSVRAKYRRQRQQRTRIGSAVLAAVVVVGGVSAFVATRSTPAHHVTISNPGDVRTLTPPATPLTAEQLAANAGRGVPKGWVPVDYHDVRIWVPSDWLVGGCTSDPNGGEVELGNDNASGQTSCASAEPAPANQILIGPSSGVPAGGTSRVNGYAVSGLPTPAGWTAYDVPALNATISLRGSLSDRVMQTLAPSALLVALNRATTAPAVSWQQITTDGLSFALPPTWKITTPNAFCGGLRGASDAPALERVTLEGEAVVPSCPPPPVEAAYALAYGGFIYTADVKDAPAPSGKPLATLRNGDTQTSIDDGSGAGTIDLFIQRDDSSTVHVMSLGLGRDGADVGGILASIRAKT